MEREKINVLFMIYNNKTRKVLSLSKCVVLLHRLIQILLVISTKFKAVILKFHDCKAWKMNNLNSMLSLVF